MIYNGEPMIIAAGFAEEIVQQLDILIEYYENDVKVPQEKQERAIEIRDTIRDILFFMKIMP